MTQTLQESISEERRTNRKLLAIVCIALSAIVLIVGVGVGIVVYNSVNNAPKIQCIYMFSKTGVNDLHNLLHNDRNPADFPDVQCRG